MNVLGLKIVGHDTGAALISNKQVYAIAEERLSRNKHSTNEFPTASINYCLDAAGLKDEDVDLIVIDQLSVNKRIDGINASSFFKTHIGTRFKNTKIETVNHHDAHAASAFFCSPFEDAAILVYDGAGETITTHLGVVAVESDTLYKGEGSKLHIISKTEHVKSGLSFLYTSGIGKLYATISARYIRLGDRSEGKMMGLSAYGDDRVLKQHPLSSWMKEYYGHLVCNARFSWPRGSISDKIKNAGSVSSIFSRALTFLKINFKKLKVRINSFMVSTFGGDLYVGPGIFSTLVFSDKPRPDSCELPDKTYSSYAYAVQKVLEHVAEMYGKKLKAITNSDNICIAGGVGLNIDANRNFIDKVGFKKIFVQPAASDTGIGLGAALWGYHTILKQPRFYKMDSASLGKVYTNAEIEVALQEHSDHIVVERPNDIVDTTAKLLRDGKIIGWFEGGSEYGPRALGNRSILVDPRPENMKDILNQRVKHREMWRPFATVILREKMSEWFDLDEDSPFMLLHAYVHKHKWKEIPSVIHVDGTSRLQTVTSEHNGKYYQLIKKFDEYTGTPLLLNTSFNDAGEPIVETPQDTLRCFLGTNIDCLVLEDYLITKKNS